MKITTRLRDSFEGTMDGQVFPSWKQFLCSGYTYTGCPIVINKFYYLQNYLRRLQNYLKKCSIWNFFGFEGEVTLVPLLFFHECAHPVVKRQLKVYFFRSYDACTVFFRYKAKARSRLSSYFESGYQAARLCSSVTFAMTPHTSDIVGNERFCTVIFVRASSVPFRELQC